MSQFSMINRRRTLLDPTGSNCIPGHQRGMEGRSVAETQEAGIVGFRGNCETPAIIIGRNSFVILMENARSCAQSDSWKFPRAFINFAVT